MAYQDVRRLGEGGFGFVDEVRNGVGKSYARKSLRVPPTMTIDQMRPRFEREVKYQSAINHKHVVPILDSNLTATPPWFIMPLAVCSLYDVMLVDRHLGADRDSVLFQILSALEEIHRLGYCHRDLKPQNVLKFDDRNGGFFYAVSDFGLIAVGEEASSTLTPSGMGGGTPAYQAPECALNFKRATARSDIYSFGAILHDIFAPNPRRLPHEELTAPGAIGSIIEKCTKRNAHRRYRDIQQLRDSLLDVLKEFKYAFESNEEKRIVEILQDESIMLNQEQWDGIFDYLDVNGAANDSTRNVFRALTRERIDQLFAEDPDLCCALGRMFAEHCRELSFDFDYCDVLAAKAQMFYDIGDTGLCADIAIGMLALGLDHNRWAVERRFLRMVSPQVPEGIIQRIVVELSVLDVDFAKEFERMTRSITVTKEALHPILQGLVP